MVVWASALRSRIQSLVLRKCSRMRRSRSNKHFSTSWYRYSSSHLPTNSLWIMPSVSKNVINMVLVFDWSGEFFGPSHSGTLWIILHTSRLMSSMIFFKKFGSWSAISTKPWTAVTRCCFCSAVNECGTKRAQSFFFFNTSQIFVCSAPLLMICLSFCYKKSC